MNNSLDLLAETLRLQAAGLSILPIGTEKRPYGPGLPRGADGKATWKPYQETPADADTVRRWFSNPKVLGVGLVCGRASGGACIIDFDEPGFYEKWSTAVGDMANGLPVQRTGGGGYQVALRTDDPGANDQLAWVPDDAQKTGRRIAIETRGEGGYACIPPSIHPSGKRYETMSGDFANIPVIPQARADALLDAARKLDEAPFTKIEIQRMRAAKVKSYPARDSHSDVIGAWNRKVPIRDMLRRASYLPFGPRFTRPGTDASPGGVVILDDSQSYHHSSNDPLCDGHAHDSFSIFCELEHGGKVKAAVKAAAQELGLPPPSAKRDAVAVAPDEMHDTDLGLARRFVAQHGAKIRFDYSRRWWLIFDGRRWARDENGEIRRLMKQTARTIWAEVAAATNDVRFKELQQFARRAESESGLKAALSMAESERVIAVTAAKLDVDPWLLNVVNGTLDLRTGLLRPHSAGDLLSRLAPVEYDPAATHQVWNSFLTGAVNHDDDLIAFLARAVGYSLTGDTGEEKLFFVHGPAAAGKSTFLEAVKSVLGDYAVVSDFETFLQRNQVGGPRNDIAALAGKRFVTSIEVDQGKRLAEGLVKMLTGGDTVSARFLYQEAFEFRPQFKLWLAANHAPRVRDDDDAMWRRILRVPFINVIPKERRDPAIKATLRDPSKAGPAVLAWAVHGCRDWQEHGLGVPPVIESATSEYRQNMDPLKDFLADRCILGANNVVGKGELRDTYESWAKENGVDAIRGKTFADKIEAHGVEDGWQHERRIWRGIGLVSPTCQHMPTSDSENFSL